MYVLSFAASLQRMAQGALMSSDGASFAGETDKGCKIREVEVIQFLLYIFALSKCVTSVAACKAGKSVPRQPA